MLQVSDILHPSAPDGTGLTGRKMCEYIAEWFKEKIGKEVDPMDIWNMSPSGELWPVFDLYWAAKMDRENLRMVLDYRQGPTMGAIEWLPWEEGKERIEYRTD